MSAVRRAVRAGAARHRLAGTVVALVVLASTAMVVLGLGLLSAANAPFDRSFAEQRGAHATVYFDPDLVTADQVRATAGHDAVRAAAGPYRTATVELAFAEDTGIRLPPAVVAGRDAPDGPVDVVHLDRGRWPQRPGEIVLARQGGGRDLRVGQRLTTGSVTLTVVGVASSITRTADAWVTADQFDALGAARTELQMLYRFDSAADEAGVAGGVAAATAGLPPGAVLGTGSYLTVRQGNDQSAATATPFVVAFAVLGMVVSVLIVANVVGGAVVAGYRHIGVLKAIGFTPAQVVAVYAGRLLLPAVIGGAAGLVAGNLLAVPVLSQAAEAYQVGSAVVPVWVDVVAVLALALVVGTAAVVPAVRAGRMPATAALTLGRAPRVGRGRHLRRRLARAPLPRPVGLGLGTPLARPARAAGAVVAVALGATTLVLATGLWTTLGRAADAVERARAAPVRVAMGGGPLQQPGTGPPQQPGGGPLQPPGGPIAPPDPAAVEAALRAVPGTAGVTAIRSAMVTVTGLAGSIEVEGYGGESAWTGYGIVSGRWFASADEAVAPSSLLTATGKRVGDRLTLAVGERRHTVRIVGEVFLPGEERRIVTHDAAVTALDPRAGVHGFEVSLAAGTDPGTYASTVNRSLPMRGVIAYPASAENDTITLFLGLIVMLVLLVIGVAGLGVFNTALLNAREQVRDIGILKTVGMTPRQVRLMVVSSLAGLGVLAGAVAVPLGIAVHRGVVHAMARAASTGLPPDLVSVFGAAGLAGLAATGVVIAVAGALVPAGWAARSRPAGALRAE